MTGSILNVALHTAGRFMFLPVGFFLNGLLLRRYRIATLCSIGAILAGIVTAVVVVGIRTPLALFIYGCIGGAAYGIYWANRNYLEFKETLADQRQYFFSLVYSVTWLASIIVPLIAGWFVILGQNIGFSPQHAY